MIELGARGVLESKCDGWFKDRLDRSDEMSSMNRGVSHAFPQGEPLFIAYIWTIRNSRRSSALLSLSLPSFAQPPFEPTLLRENTLEQITVFVSANVCLLLYFNVRLNKFYIFLLLISINNIFWLLISININLDMMEIFTQLICIFYFSFVIIFF